MASAGLPGSQTTLTCISLTDSVSLLKKVKSLITNEGLDAIIADFDVVRFGDVDDMIRHGDLTRSLMQTSWEGVFY